MSCVYRLLLVVLYLIQLQQNANPTAPLDYTDCLYSDSIHYANHRMLWNWSFCVCLTLPLSPPSPSVFTLAGCFMGALLYGALDPFIISSITHKRARTSHDTWYKFTQSHKQFSYTYYSKVTFSTCPQLSTERYFSGKAVSHEWLHREAHALGVVCKH